MDSSRLSEGLDLRTGFEANGRELFLTALAIASRQPTSLTIARISVQLRFSQPVSFVSELAEAGSGRANR